MFLYNVAAKRELQEGDEVDVLWGRNAGKIGTVIGFDLYGASPVVVQYDGTVSILREMFAANEVQVRSCKAPRELEPLPEVRTMLTEMQGLTLSLDETPLATLKIGHGVTLTLLPKQKGAFRRIYESAAHQSLDERVVEMLKASIVTRLPHLIAI